jgi:hypothetical protein
MSLVDGEESGWHVPANVMSLPQSIRKRHSKSGEPFFSHEFALCGLYFAVRKGISSATDSGLTGDPPVLEIVSCRIYLGWFPDELAETKRV